MAGKPRESRKLSMSQVQAFVQKHISTHQSGIGRHEENIPDFEHGIKFSMMTIMNERGFIVFAGYHALLIIYRTEIYTSSHFLYH